MVGPGALGFGMFVGSLFFLTATFQDGQLAVLFSILIGVLSFLVLTVLANR